MMKARLRVVIAVLVLAFGGGGALAQQTQTAPANEVVGNPQLQDFSLNGTVTRRSEEPSQPPPRASTAQPSRERQPAGTARTEPPSERPAPREPQAQTRRVATPAPDFAPPTPARQAPLTTEPREEDPNGIVDGPPPVDAPLTEPSGSALPSLPWILAALALIGAGAWFLFLRQRPRESFAGVSPEAVEADPPAPAPEPALRRAATPAATEPAAAPPAAPTPQPSSSGLVSTRLRPWIELSLTPGRAIIDEEKAAFEFEVGIFNSGSAPARDVRIEAALFNAGPAQDEQISAFFHQAMADAAGGIAAVPPLQRMTIRTAVFLPRNQLVPLEIEGRSLFVPLIGVTARYAWSTGQGQSSASYLIGKATQGDKLAPFRLDAAPRLFRNLESREHELHVRA